MPQGDLLSEVALSGLEGGSVQFNIDPDQIQVMYESGSINGSGSADEFRMLASQYLTQELELRRDEFLLAEWLDRIAEVNVYLKNKSDDLVGSEEISLNAEVDDEEMPKFWSGFGPLDEVMGGLYQGIITIMAKSGHGKTSFMLSLMEAFRQSNVADELWFFENEIPVRLMMYRLRASRQRTQFKSGDKMICGFTSSAEILRRVIEEPNPNRVIFIDSPDVMAGGMGENKRHGIEAIYRDMVSIKERSMLVVAASQVRRRDGRTLTMESVAEAWTKVHYSDMLATAVKLGPIVRGYSQVRMTVPKNRFGLADQEVTFGYNYADLSWDFNGGQAKAVNVDEDDW